MSAVVTLSVAVIVALTALPDGANAGVPGEIRHYFDDFEEAVKENNAARVANFYTENAVLASNKTVVVGRKAIADFWSRVFKKGFKSLKYNLETVEPRGEADWAVAIGTFEADGILHASGPFSKLFRKENGRWLSDLHRCTVYRLPEDFLD
ncbi:hypothetical protein AAVH_22349 [Aphelenchoides avenae]|nr:hypothetical protein AAVH_22349 [Aphelenchus avenae]